MFPMKTSTVAIPQLVGMFENIFIKRSVYVPNGRPVRQFETFLMFQ